MAAALLAAGTADAASGGTAGPQGTGGPVSVRIGLAGRDPAGLEAFARAVSTPGSPQYGHYLTPAQARARFGATDAQVKAVRKWLGAAGMRVTNQDPHWIDATGSVGAVRKAFGSGTRTLTLTSTLTRTLTPTTVPGPASIPGSTSMPAPMSPPTLMPTLTLPPEVAGSVASVARLGQARERGMREGASVAITARRGLLAGHSPGATPRSRPSMPSAPFAPFAPSAPHAGAVDEGCSASWGAVTADPDLPPGYGSPEPIDVCGYVPSRLRTAYGVDASGLNGSGVTVAVLDAYGSLTMLSDADRFAQAHGDAAFAAGQYQETVTSGQWTHTTDGVCQTPGDWAGEEALDVETVHGMAPGATVHYFGANSCADEDINAALANIVDTHAADIVSSSFGETMHRLSGTIDQAQIAQATQVFQYAAAEGIGLYFASGDCGDDSVRTGPGCDPESARAQTEWPVSSPWVTGVGGTALALGADDSPLWQTSMGDRRSALSDDGKSWTPFPGDFYFGGGGGTSEDFPQPAYQKGVVPDALARTLGSGAQAAGPMRTLPDVAMDGDLLTAVQVGVTDASGRYGETSVGGTSVAAPMFAATQADGQQARVAAGGKAIGFANPDVYRRATSATFTDVVAQPAGAPADISTVLDLGTDAQGKRQVRLFELGHDQGLPAGPGYDLATGLGSPREEYLNSFKH